MSEHSKMMYSFQGIIWYQWQSIELCRKGQNIKNKKIPGTIFFSKYRTIPLGKKLHVRVQYTRQIFLSLYICIFIFLYFYISIFLYFYFSISLSLSLWDLPCVLGARTCNVFPRGMVRYLEKKIVPGIFLFLMFWPFPLISTDCRRYRWMPRNEYIIFPCSDINFDSEIDRLSMIYDFSKNIRISKIICRRKKLRPPTESPEQAEQLCSSLLSLYEAGKPPKIDVEKVKKWTRIRTYMDCLSQLHGWVLWKKILNFGWCVYWTRTCNVFPRGMVRYLYFKF